MGVSYQRCCLSCRAEEFPAPEAKDRRAIPALCVVTAVFCASLGSRDPQTCQPDYRRSGLGRSRSTGASPRRAAADCRCTVAAPMRYSAVRVVRQRALETTLYAASAGGNASTAASSQCRKAFSRRQPHAKPGPARFPAALAAAMLAYVVEWRRVRCPQLRATNSFS
jgi:hypothetical protein